MRVFDDVATMARAAAADGARRDPRSDRRTRRGERDARDRQLAARVPRRARHATPISTGHASPRSTWTSTSDLRADALRQLPALHARAGRGAAARSRSSTTSPATPAIAQAEAERYADLLRAHPLDLCCCGIGENGHLAFNDPPVADFDDPRRRQDRRARARHRAASRWPRDTSRRSTTCRRTRSPSPSPRSCARAGCWRSFPRRARPSPVRDALQGPISTACPASILRRQPNAILYLDAESSSLLDA